jgi:hypothetical protein
VATGAVREGPGALRQGSRGSGPRERMVPLIPRRRDGRSLPPA